MTEVKCPTCGKPVPWSQDNAARPFCSERCKLIDLGAWASDRYSIFGGATAADDAAPADTDDSR